MNIALVAHDSRKDELVEWVTYNLHALKEHVLYATGTTSKLLERITVLEDDMEFAEESLHPLKGKINMLLSGPLGGDQQIGAMIAEGKIDLLIFFCDNLVTQGHHNDVSALTRLASLYNIAFATNRTTADMIMTSPLLNDETYTKITPSAIENYANRKL